MHHKRIIISIVAIATMLSAYKLLYTPKKPQEIAPIETLIIGTNAEFPPFTFINDQNEIVGFDIDIAKEVAHRLGKTIDIKDRSFDMLIPEAHNGSVHIIAAGMTATPERALQIIFTKPYLSGEPLVVLTLAQNPITRIEDLYGKEVIVNEGYTADAYVSARPEILVKRLPAPAEAILDLQTGKSFAYVSAINAIKPYVQKFGEKAFNIFTIEDARENTAMGISKQYPELLAIIQPILDAMESDGTIEQLKKKWNLS